jgi:hypothetical protein
MKPKPDTSTARTRILHCVASCIAALVYARLHMVILCNLQHQLQSITACLYQCTMQYVYYVVAVLCCALYS